MISAIVTMKKTAMGVLPHMGILPHSTLCRERLKSRHSFVLAARKLLDSLSEMDVRAAQWTNTKWDMEYSANALSLHAFIPKANSRPLGMGLPRAAWVKLNRLRSGVGRFCSSMYK